MYYRQFIEFNEQISQSCRIITSCSNDLHSNSVIYITLTHLKQISHHVCYATQALCARPRSLAARQCLEILITCWTQELTILLETLDFVIILSDLLVAFEIHTTNYSITLIEAVKVGENELIMKYHHNIVTCTKKLLTVTEHYLEGNRLNMKKDVYSKVTKLQSDLRNQSDLLNKKTIHISSSASLDTTQCSEYETVVQNICDLVCNIQNEFLLSMQQSIADETLDDSSTLPGIDDTLTPNNGSSQDISTSQGESPGVYSYKSLSKSRSPAHEPMDTQIKDILTSLPQSEFARLETARNEFTVEQIRLEKEVSKWDETENDIIFMAKDMCMMMLDMSDFTKGVGPIHNANDLISTTDNLAGTAERLILSVEYIIHICDGLVDCKDISAYLDEIHLYSQQIKITSKVYRDMQQIRQDPTSVSSLVISAKNLLKCVIKTVTASYIACNKLSRSGNSIKVKGLGIVKWKMKPPTKKPLCRSSSVYSVSSITSRISKRSKKSSIGPLDMLMNEFETELRDQIDFI